MGYHHRVLPEGQQRQRQQQHGCRRVLLGSWPSWGGWQEQLRQRAAAIRALTQHCKMQ
jgi:hypothetical protein